MLDTALTFATIPTVPVSAQGVRLPSGGQVAAYQASHDVWQQHDDHAILGQGDYQLD